MSREQADRKFVADEADDEISGHGLKGDITLQACNFEGKIPLGTSGRAAREVYKCLVGELCQKPT